MMCAIMPVRTEPPATDQGGHMATDPKPMRTGGMVTFRKPGRRTQVALIEWVYADGAARVRPERGARQVIVPADVERAAKLLRKVTA